MAPNRALAFLGSGRKCWLELSGDIGDKKGSTSTYRESMFV